MNLPKSRITISDYKTNRNEYQQVELALSLFVMNYWHCQKERKKHKGYWWLVPISRTSPSITHQLKYDTLFTVWEVSEQDFKLHFRNVFIMIDWYYVIDFTTVSWTQTLRGQRHNAHENENMNAAAGVNEQNVWKIHITKQYVMWNRLCHLHLKFHNS